MGVTVRLKSEPPPVKVITCGLLGALSVNTRDPVRVPTTTGLKVTLTVQTAPTPRLDPQLLVWRSHPWR